MARKLGVLLWFGVLILLAACGGEAAVVDAPAATEAVETSNADVEISPGVVETPEILRRDYSFEPPNLTRDETDLVTGSGICVSCHDKLENGFGVDYAFHKLWRSSMMAHAANDPYWLATVSMEVSQHSGLQEVIEDKCSRCHMPMANFDATTKGNSIAIFGDGFANPENPLYELALDSVSCTLCHQILPDNFGLPESFSGGFYINPEGRVRGARKAYGPFPTFPQPEMIMADGSGFIPYESAHVIESEICASCHDLYTPFLDASGAIAGTFPEQTVYSEWKNSGYNGTATCQDCHMPKITEGQVQVSDLWGPSGNYVRLHTFTGANAFMLNLLNANSEALSLTAEEEHMQAAIERVTHNLQAESASLSIEELSVTDGILTAKVVVQPLTGHKFPSGYPSRRAWLHITVTDAAGTVLFESGAVEASGLIAGNDNDEGPTAFEPHFLEISSPDQVQIYESIMLNTDGQVTTDLLLGAAYGKDNRLLPQGFSLDSGVDIAPYGAAASDPDFTAGSDTVVYLVDVSGASGAVSVHVELLYQSIGYRWAENLRTAATPEVESFFEMYDAETNLPIVVGEVTENISP